jgi:ATP-dependent DNA helicase RecQ
LKKAGFIEMRARARYGLTADALKNRELVLSLTNYDTKKSYDQSKLAMMLQYSETRGCRRKFILNYFGEEYDRDGCGECDNCLRTKSLASFDASVTSGYKIADVVTHPKFGQGTVERAEKDLVTVLFPTVGYKTLLASAVIREAKIA